MAGAATKAAVVTTLRLQTIAVPVALYGAHADPKKKLMEFETAGPHGGRLVTQQVAVAVPEKSDAPVDEPSLGMGDPLADDGPSLVPRDFDDLKIPTDFGVTQAELDPPAPAGEYRHELVEEGSQEVVPPDAIRRGVRKPDGVFVDCTTELARLDEQTKLEEMTVVAFVDSSAVPRVRVKNAYYLGARDAEAAPKWMRLLYEAMRQTRRAAVVKLTKRSRQSLGLITTTHETLMLLELVWSEDFREPHPSALALREAQVSEREIENAVTLVQKMSDGPGVIDELRDDAIEKREQLYARAVNGEFVGDVVADAEPSDEESKLLADLEASLAAASVS